MGKRDGQGHEWAAAEQYANKGGDTAPVSLFAVSDIDPVAGKRVKKTKRQERGAGASPATSRTLGAVP
jgi:hypothetical protein